MGRILILDDELFALDGSRRVLRPLTPDCELLFADNGFQALDWMAQQPVDLVLADLMMPGMKGTEFLSEVQRRFPQTARLILSGYTDREMMLRCVPLAHQTIAKPCPPDVLLSILRRVLHFVVGIQNRAVRGAVLRTAQLPMHPAVRRDLLQSATCSGERALAKLISLATGDIGLAAAVLKLANSPMLQPDRPIASIAQAVSSLGVEAVLHLVLGENCPKNCSRLEPLPGPFSRPAVGERGPTPFANATVLGEGHLPEPAWDGSPEAHGLAGIWKHSLDTAIGAQTIARMEHGEQDLLHEAFASGLLHDAGKFLLVSHFPAEYTEAVRLAVEENIEISSVERRLFGATHAELGAALLGLWGFPASMLAAVSRHHLPGENGGSFDALTAVHVANALVHECDSFPVSSSSGFDAGYLSALSLSARLDAWRAAVRDILSVNTVSA